MKHKYTVTTETKYCPHCGYIFSEKTKGLFTPLYPFLFLLLAPMLISYWLIRYLFLRNPKIPKVGPKTFICCNCSKKVSTGNLSIEELNAEEMTTFRFKKWIYTCYVLSIICSAALYYMAIQSLSLISIFGIIPFISFLGIVTIVVAYHISLAQCRPKNENYSYSIKTYENKIPNTLSEETQEMIFCHKCGIKMPIDSRFCEKCGTDISK